MATLINFEQIKKYWKIATAAAGIVLVTSGGSYTVWSIVQDGETRMKELSDGSRVQSGSLLVKDGPNGVLIEGNGNIGVGDTVTTDHLYANTIEGAGLTDCDQATDKLQWDIGTLQFGCVPEAGGGGGNFGTGNVIDIGDPRYVLKGGDTMSGPLQFNVSAAGTLNFPTDDISPSMIQLSSTLDYFIGRADSTSSLGLTGAPALATSVGGGHSWIWYQYPAMDGNTRMELTSGGNLYLQSLDTDLSSPTPSGNVSLVKTDGNGMLNFGPEEDPAYYSNPNAYLDAGNISAYETDPYYFSNPNGYVTAGGGYSFNISDGVNSPESIDDADTLTFATDAYIDANVSSPETITITSTNDFANQMNQYVGNTSDVGFNSLSVSSDSYFYGHLTAYDQVTIGDADTDTMTVNSNTTFNGTNDFQSPLSIFHNQLNVGDDSSDVFNVNSNSSFFGPVSLADSLIIGDNSGDNVTVNSATWTFNNDTNFSLSGGQNGLSFDTNTLSIDASADRVGIGTTTPKAKLDVLGTISGALLTQNGAGLNYLMGNVGISKTTPTTALDVRGTISGSLITQNGAGNNYFRGNVGLGGDTTPSTALEVLGTMSGSTVSLGGGKCQSTANGIFYCGGFINDANLPIQIVGTVAQYGVSRTNGTYGLLFGSFNSTTYAMRAVQATDNLSFIVNSSTQALNIIPNGNVGIATTAPNAKLAVLGTISGSLVTQQGAGNNSFMGNVGIGATTAKTKLEVVGTISGSLIAQHGAGDNFFQGNIGLGKTPTVKLDVRGTVSGALLTQNGAGNNFFMGNVGMGGETSPSSSLEVRGTTSGSVIIGGTISGSMLRYNNLSPRKLQMEVFSSGSTVSTGSGKMMFTVADPTMSGAYLKSAHFSVQTAGTTNTTSLQIRNAGKANCKMFSTAISIDSAENGSDTAATPYVINSACRDIGAYQRLIFDIPSVSTTVPKGSVQIFLEFYKP